MWAWQNAGQGQDSGAGSSNSAPGAGGGGGGPGPGGAAGGQELSDMLQMLDQGGASSFEDLNMFNTSFE